MTTDTRTRSAFEVCSTCGKTRSPIAYARAKEVHAYIPAYHHLGTEQMMRAYQQDQLTLFRKLMDYERVVSWARTTPNRIVGIAHRQASHPLRWYLNEVNPAPGGRDRWDLFLSACDALKSFPHLPHDRGISIFGSFHLHPAGVSFTLYCPLPRWTWGLLAELEAFPRGARITQELFLTLLRARL
jgi:hypothetical protein